MGPGRLGEIRLMKVKPVKLRRSKSDDKDRPMSSDSSSSDVDALSPNEFFEALDSPEAEKKAVDLSVLFDPIDARRVQSDHDKDKLTLRFSNRSREFKEYYKEFLAMGCEKFMKNGQEFSVLISGPLQEESIRCELVQTRVINQRIAQIKDFEKGLLKNPFDYFSKASDQKKHEATEEENKKAKAESSKLEKDTGLNILRYMTTHRANNRKLDNLVIFSGTLTEEKKVAPQLQQKSKSKAKLTPIEQTQPLCGPKRNQEQLKQIASRDSKQLNADEAWNETIEIKLEDYLGSAYKERKEQLKAKKYRIFELIPWNYETNPRNEMYADAKEELTQLLKKRADLQFKLDNEAKKIAENRLAFLYEKYDAESLYKLYQDWNRLKTGNVRATIAAPLTQNREIDKKAIISKLISENYLSLLSERQASTKKFLLTEFPVFIKSLMEEKERHVKKAEAGKEEIIEGADYDGYPFGPDDSLGRGVYSLGAILFQNIFGDFREWHRWINTTSLMLGREESPKAFFSSRWLSSSPIGAGPESSMRVSDYQPLPPNASAKITNAERAADKDSREKKPREKDSQKQKPASQFSAKQTETERKGSAKSKSKILKSYEHTQHPQSETELKLIQAIPPTPSSSPTPDARSVDLAMLGPLSDTGVKQLARKQPFSKHKELPSLVTVSRRLHKSSPPETTPSGSPFRKSVIASILAESQAAHKGSFDSAKSPSQSQPKSSPGGSPVTKSSPGQSPLKSSSNGSPATKSSPGQSPLKSSSNGSPVTKSSSSISPPKFLPSGSPLPRSANALVNAEVQAARRGSPDSVRSSMSLPKPARLLLADPIERKVSVHAMPHSLSSIAKHSVTVTELAPFSELQSSVRRSPTAQSVVSMPILSVQRSASKGGTMSPPAQLLELSAIAGSKRRNPSPSISPTRSEHVPTESLARTASRHSLPGHKKSFSSSAITIVALQKSGIAEGTIDAVDAVVPGLQRKRSSDAISHAALTQIKEEAGNPQHDLAELALLQGAFLSKPHKSLPPLKSVSGTPQASHLLNAGVRRGLVR